MLTSMSMTNFTKYDFQKIRASCVDLSRYTFLPSNLFNPNDTALLSTIDKLLSVLSEQQECVDFPIGDKNLADYVFVPVSQLLKHNITQKSKPLLIRILKLLTIDFQIWGTLDNAHFKQFLPLILMVVGKKEEIVQYEVVVDVLESFLHCFQSFDTNDFALLAFVAQLIQLILYIAETPNLDTPLRLRCLQNCLNFLLFDIIHGDEEILAFISPGIISSLIRVLLGVSKSTNNGVSKSATLHKTPQILVIQALQILGHLISKVYCDTSLMDVMSGTTAASQNDVIGLLEETAQELAFPPASGNSNSTSKVRQRDATWLKGTRYQVLKSLKSFFPTLLQRNSAAVNEALIGFCKNLLLNCNKSLNICKKLLTATVLAVQHQEEKYLFMEHGIILEILNEIDLTKTILFQGSNSDIGMLLSALCYLDKQNEDDSLVIKKMVLDLCQNLFNYMNSKTHALSNRIYHNNGETVIHPGINMQKLKPMSDSQNMTRTIRERGTVTQSSNLAILSSSKDIKEELVLGKYFTSEMELKMSEILQKFGSQLSSDCMYDLSETILNMFDNNASAVWMVTELLGGVLLAGGNSNNIVNEFLTFDDESDDMDSELIAECSVLLVETSNEKLVSLLNNNDVILDKKTQLSLTASLHSISRLIDIAPDIVQEELIDLLPAIVECLTLSDDLVRHNAQFLMMKLATTFTASQKITDLIYDNISYIVDYCGIKLKNNTFMRCSVILSVVCQIGGYEMISKFSDVMESIFEVLDYHHDSEYTDICIEIFQLFDIVLREIRKRYVQTDEKRLIDGGVSLNTDALKPWGMSNIDQVIELTTKQVIRLEDTTRKSEQVRELDSDDEDDDIDGDDKEHPQDENSPTQSINEERPWVSPIPKSAYELIVQITNYGERLLTTTNSLVLKNLIINCISNSVPLLATQYDSFLPQVAQSLWKVIYDMSIENVLLMESSFKCLRLMIHFSQKFIIDRFINLWTSYREKNNSVSKYLIQPTLLLKEKDESGDTAESKTVETMIKAPIDSHTSFKNMQNVKKEFKQMITEGLNISMLKMSDVEYCNISYCIDHL